MRCAHVSWTVWGPLQTDEKGQTYQLRTCQLCNLIDKRYI